jgi:precorrin-6B methylase 2
MSIRIRDRAYQITLAVVLGTAPFFTAHAGAWQAAGRTAGHWPQWRGPDRLNLSSDKGLLEKWPMEGPPLLWQVNGVGQGVGPAAVAAGKVYILGHRDKDEHLTAVDETTGKPLWSVALGPSRKEYDPMRWLSQRTPLVDGERIYAVTAMGQLACVNAVAGKRLWHKDYARDFEGRRGAFGVCDQLVIDGDQLIAVPGGKSATVIALNKRTGAVIWKCPAGDTAGYVGAVVVNGKGVRKHYVAVTAQGLVGVSTEGKVLWRNERFRSSTANSCTPNILGNKLFWTQNYGRGAILLELSDVGDGVEARQEYRQALATPSWHEMVVCVGNHAYVGINSGVCCLELATGKILWQGLRAGKEYRPPFSGTWADGRLYLRTQQGTVLLVKVTPEGNAIEGQFQLPGVKTKAGSTAPVVTAARLYLRDEERLFCYDVLHGSKPGKPAVFEAPPLGKGEKPKEPGTEREADAIYVPTPHDVVEKMLELAKVKKTDTLVDLGCGDGRIVVAAARQYGCRAVGYEIDPECVRMSLVNVKKHAVGARVTIEQKDLFTADLAKVDVVTLYLPPRVTGRLLPRLERLPAGARVVAHAFALPGIVADRQVVVTAKEDRLERTLYLSTAPLKKAKRAD